MSTVPEGPWSFKMRLSIKTEKSGDKVKIAGSKFSWKLAAPMPCEACKKLTRRVASEGKGVHPSCSKRCDVPILTAEALGK